MNNEPVAWMYKVNGEHQAWSFIKPPSDAYDEGSLIALYTHPADHEKTFNEMVELYEKQLDKKADRIAELESCINDCYTVQKMQAEEVLKGADHIAELEKDLELKTRDRDVFKNFTLAYEERITELEKAFSDVYKEYKEYYTHPAKTLTDEEIEEVARPYCDLQNWVVDKHEFARAILRKASEK